MSFAVSPSPRPLSGSSLVIEVRVQVGFGSQMSVTVTVAQTWASLWFGGHSTSRSSTTVITGGVVSTTLMVALHGALFPNESVAVKVIRCEPTSRQAGASLERVGAESQLSVADAAAKKPVSCGSSLGVPQCDEHSTVMFEGQVRTSR